MKNLPILIYEGVQRCQSAEIPRSYLGMSLAGNPCELSTWHYWRHTTGKEIDGRILMLFQLGNKVEEVVCAGLRKAGFILSNAYPDKQLTFSDFNGWFSGHPDGLIQSEFGPMILEIKSANTNKFKQFSEKGVREVYPAYYMQMQLYMHYSGLKKACFVVMKKDDSTIYSEEVDYDEKQVEITLSRVKKILTTHTETGKIYIPEKASIDPKSEICQWCKYQVNCYEPETQYQTVQSCRSCAYMNIKSDWKPFCGHSAHKVELKNLNRACPQWAWVLQTPFTIDEIKF